MTWYRIVLLVFFVKVVASHGALETFPELASSGGVSRIVSGWEARDGQFPFQFSLRMINLLGGVSSCGGSIIHQEWGMTAAHCTAGRESFVIRLGGVNLTRPGLILDTTEFYNHPLYDESIPGVVQPHDIGVIKFGRVIQWTDNIQPIRIQPSVDKDRNYRDQTLVAAGWGITWTGGSGPENMNWVYLTGISNLVCWVQFSFSRNVVDSTICASPYNVTSQSICSGDSGGTLTVLEADGLRTQIGVSSFVSGRGCHVNMPGAFIRPGHYHDWFTEVTGVHFDWDPQSIASTNGDVYSNE